MTAPFTREPFLSLQKSVLQKQDKKHRNLKNKNHTKNRAPIKVPCKSVLLTLFNAFLLCPCPFSQRSLLRFTVHLLCFLSALYCLFAVPLLFFQHSFLSVGVFGEMSKRISQHFIGTFQSLSGFHQSFEASSFKYALKSSLSSG